MSVNNATTAQIAALRPALVALGKPFQELVQRGNSAATAGLNTAQISALDVQLVALKAALDPVVAA